MIEFMIGLCVGAILGVGIMCILQFIDKEED